MKFRPEQPFAEEDLCREVTNRAAGRKDEPIGDVLVNPHVFWAIARRLNAKIEGDPKTPWQFVTLHTPKATIRMFSDPACPRDEFHFTALLLSLSPYFLALNARFS